MLAARAAGSRIYRPEPPRRVRLREPPEGWAEERLSGKTNTALKGSRVVLLTARRLPSTGYFFLCHIQAPVAQQKKKVYKPGDPPLKSPSYYLWNANFASTILDLYTVSCAVRGATSTWGRVDHRSARTRSRRISTLAVRRLLSAESLAPSSCAAVARGTYRSHEV